MGSYEIKYSVPQQAKDLFITGILNNPLISSDLPPRAQDYASKIKFNGSNAPSLPINWRFAESISALKGLEAIMLLALLDMKYNIRPEEVMINTDHAQWFVMSALHWEVNDPHDGVKITAHDCIHSAEGQQKMAKYFPSYDFYRLQSTLHRGACTNIYKTKDGRFFHLHGSMNPDLSLESIGLPPEMDHDTIEDAWQTFGTKISNIDSQDMQRLASDVYKQAGTICWTTEEYKKSAHGQANSHVGLFELEHLPNTDQKPCWWPSSEQTGPQRPLAGLKVVDITRVIAAPAITRGLAEMGASVMRITAPHLQDYSTLHCDLNWGKWNTALDFRVKEDLEKAKALIRDADVVVTGYRPGVLEKWGLGLEGILEICKVRDRGVVHLQENCYGWNGPWSYRSGWQQISDACCGVSMQFGRAMGNDEPVTPILPNSDYCTGVAGVSAVLRALMLRAMDGGSYSVKVALNYYSQWLVNSCGTYPEEVWNELWTRAGNPVFRHYHNMTYAIPRMFKSLNHTAPNILYNEDFMEERDCKNIGIKIKTIKPILRFPGEEVKLGFNVGTRTNGVDKARWPEDLMVEVVT